MKHRHEQLHHIAVREESRAVSGGGTERRKDPVNTKFLGNK